MYSLFTCLLGKISLNSDVAGLVASLLLADRRKHPLQSMEEVGERKCCTQKALKRARVKALKGRTKQELACEDVEA